MKDNTIIIMRGASGSGKSYWVRRLKERFAYLRIQHMAEDDLYYDKDGFYEWTPEREIWAHRKQVEVFLANLRNPHLWDVLIVDNLNTLTEEVGVFYGLALLYGFHPLIKEMDGHHINRHDVPKKEVARHCNQLKANPTPAHWPLYKEEGI